MANVFSSVANAFAVPFAIGLGIVSVVLIILGVHGLLFPEPSGTSKTPSNTIGPKASSILFTVIGSLLLLVSFKYPSYVRNNPNFATRVGVLESVSIAKRVF